MDIVHLILGKANPERMNGVNKVVYNLATQQEEYGCKVSVWGITKDLKKNFPQRNFDTQLFLKSRNPFGIPKALKQAILDSHSETVFHLHGGWIPVFYSLSQFLVRHQRKLIITPHGAYNVVAMNKNRWIKKLYFNGFERQVLASASKIHCIGKTEVVGLQKIYKTNKTVLIPYGFQLLKDSAKFFIGKDIIFGYIGRLDLYTKGLDVMIDAFENFLSQHANAQLWIIGDGKDRATIQNIINSKKLNSKIRLLGGKFGKEKNVLLQQMDVFLHPSRNEGLPVSILEAASFGKPCVVSFYTNIGEQLVNYNAGIMFADYNYMEMSQAMQKLYKVWGEKSLFMEMGENAQQMVQKGYNWQTILNRLNTELYGS